MRAKKVDNNQSAVVELARKMGASVFITSAVGDGFGDLVIGYRGKNFIWEVKDGDDKKLRPKQIKFRNSWKGNYHVIRHLDDVLNFFKCFEILHGKDVQETWGSLH